MAECPGIHVLTQAADGLLARVRLPGGRLDGSQARGLSAAARALGAGAIELTSRCNLQIRGLSPEAGRALPEALAPFGLAYPAEVDRRRNILGDALAGLDPDEVLDVSGLVAALDRALIGHPGLQGLSPKFSFALDGGGRSGTLAHGHDAGLRAERWRDAVVCRLSLGDRPTRWGVPVESAVPALIAVAEAVARLGPKARARVVGDRGGALARILEAPGPVISLGDPEPASPEEPLIGQRAQRGPDRVAFGLAPSAGSLEAADLDGLAGLAQTFGDGTLRLTASRGVLLANVAAARIARLETSAAAQGFLTRPPAVLVAACSGRACARGLSDARQDGAALARALSHVAMAGRPTVHVSACARGCAHPGTADVLAVAKPGGRYDLYRDAAARTADLPAVAGVSSAGLAYAAHHLLTSRGHEMRNAS